MGHNEGCPDLDLKRNGTEGSQPWSGRSVKEIGSKKKKKNLRVNGWRCYHHLTFTQYKATGAAGAGCTPLGKKAATAILQRT
jgi:hypothetical protein